MQKSHRQETSWGAPNAARDGRGRRGAGRAAQGVSGGCACRSLQSTLRNVAFILKDGSLFEACTEELCDLIYFLKEPLSLLSTEHSLFTCEER